ncbi:tripartite tricarboxylate transporter TctB family protein [Geomicrobium sp. JCM 19038]|uniref:tripartite tricarboxylate transporter TctB family protein n=1 Tax=Geomicrobium sp. JCM 19038 TaxID=1460635 RepID=UPI00045F1EFF|nr:tripartite tricarboxylate transporter TctB family protein [Geomicrobium sp. JCM 19038]GAK08851.1 tricarboxylate transport protein TctB [Geomicrobium sp. JCM 19038]
MALTVHRGVSIVLIIIAIFYLYLAFQLPSFMNTVIDADTIPKITGFLLIILSVLYFFMPVKETEVEKEKRTEAKNDWRYILGMFIMTFLYITLLEVSGFLVTSIVFIFVCTRMLGYKKWKTNSIVSVLVPLFLYLSFTFLLNVRLPTGFMPF